MYPGDIFSIKSLEELATRKGERLNEYARDGVWKGLGRRRNTW